MRKSVIAMGSFQTAIAQAKAIALENGHEIVIVDPALKEEKTLSIEVKQYKIPDFIKEEVKLTEIPRNKFFDKPKNNFKK